MARLNCNHPIVYWDISLKKWLSTKFTVRSLKISSAELMSNSPFPPKFDFDDILWISNFQDRGRNHVVWLFKWNLFFLSLSPWRKFYGETNRIKASEQFFLRYIFRVSCSNCSNAVLLWGTLVQFGFKFRVSERNPLVWSSGKRTSFGALFRCSWSWFHFSSESGNKIVCCDHSNRTFSGG